MDTTHRLEGALHLDRTRRGRVTTPASTAVIGAVPATGAPGPGER